MRRYLLIAGVAVSLSACIMPGRNALLENSFREDITVSGDYRDVAFCVTRYLDEEKFSFSELPARVTRTIQKEGEIELQAGNQHSVEILLWVGEFKRVSPSVTTVTLIVRREAHPLIKTDYYFQKVRAVVLSCGKAPVSD